MNFSLLINFFNTLTHPFLAQGLLTVFVLLEGLKCIKKVPNTALHHISIIVLFLLFIYALYAHVWVDTRYLFVMQNNHPAQAIHYRVASLWSHHETSLFIWLVILNATTYILRLPPLNPYTLPTPRIFQRHRPAALDHRVKYTKLVGADVAQFRGRILGLLNCLLGFYMLMEANPFATTPLALLTQESYGLNPLLYDLNMVWHPPLLYLGVTWLFTPYVLSLWLYRTGDAALIPLVQQQTRMAFGLLTLAIALGSFWAFTQLGWGGFWFWDPVETASLLPWVAALIVFHCTPMTLKEHPWIGCLPFAAVILSLWAVRSGILVSVHSFANDIMAFWLLGALMVFTWMPVLVLVRKSLFLASLRCARSKPRAKTRALIPTLSSSIPTLSSSIPTLSSPRRRGSSLLNVWRKMFSWIPAYAGMTKKAGMTSSISFLKIGISLLALTLLLLMLGLFIPVIFDFSLAPTFFNTILLPIWIVIALLMVLAPYKSFRLGASTTTALLGLMLYLIFYSHLALPYLLLGASGTICASAMIPLIRTKPRVSFAHMGIGLCLIGLASHSDSPPEVTLTLSRNVPVMHNAYRITFKDTIEIAESFKTNQMTQISIHTNNIGSSWRALIKGRGDGEGSYNNTFLILTPARQFFHSSKLQRVKADFGLLNQRVVMITNIETLPDARVAITFHEKFGLIWLVIGCGLIVISLLVISLFSFSRRLIHHHQV